MRIRQVSTATLIPAIAPADRPESGTAGDRQSLLLESSVVLIAFEAFAFYIQSPMWFTRLGLSKNGAGNMHYLYIIL